MLLRRLVVVVTVVAVLVGIGGVSVSFSHGVRFDGISPAMADPAPGETWTARSAAEANSWRSVAYGNGVFVAVSMDGTNRVMTSPDGVTWTARSAAEANAWWSVTYGNGMFVAVATDGANQVMTSTDGVTWTARSAEANGWRSVTYANGRFVAVATSGTKRVMTSTDGLTWTVRSVPQESNWSSVTYGNGVFVAVAANGAYKVMTSTDGETWTARSAWEQNPWNSVVYGNGVFVSVAPSGTNRVMTSTDGETWTGRSAAEASTWQSVTYANGVFVAVASTGTNRVMTSTNGETWTARSAAEASTWRSVAYANGLFVAVASAGTNRVMTSGVYVPPTAPVAPTSLIATSGSGSASIEFTAGANGGSAITKYQYRVGSGAWTDVVGTTSPITVTGLTNFVSASIRLRAVNSVGNGAASVAVTVTPRLAGPTAASAASSGSTGIVVTFNLNPLPGTTVAYQSVVAYARGTNTVKGSCRTYGKQKTCYVGGLTRSTDYDLRVTAHLPVPGKTWHNTTFEGSILQVRTNR
jgi:hypothetical protein